MLYKYGTNLDNKAEIADDLSTIELMNKSLFMHFFIFHFLLKKVIWSNN